MKSVTAPSDVRGLDAAFVEAWEAWRARRREELLEPYGLLSPTGLHWLTSEPQRLDDVPGRWRIAEDTVVVEAGADEGLRVGGDVLDGQFELPVEQASAADIMFGGTVVDLLVFDARQHGKARCALRPRDPRSPRRVNFSEIPAYPPDPAWVVPARFEPYDMERHITVDSVVPTLQKELHVFGRVVVTLDGHEHSLEVFSATTDVLRIPFSDLTSGKTTGLVRVLSVPWSSTRSATACDLVLDFNRAENGPAGLTPYATCALPPRGNTLPVAVEAGEKLPAW